MRVGDSVVRYGSKFLRIKALTPAGFDIVARNT
jgi:hypothetical protein